MGRTKRKNFADHLSFGRKHVRVLESISFEDLNAMLYGSHGIGFALNMQFRPLREGRLCLEVTSARCTRTAYILSHALKLSHARGLSHITVLYAALILMGSRFSTSRIQKMNVECFGVEVQYEKR